LSIDHADHTLDHEHGLDGHRHAAPGSALRVGIGGPVGSGKTELVACLCAALAGELSVVAVTNDVFTTEDAAILRRRGALPVERIDNVEAVEALEARFAPDLVLVESGGDNLTATFSRALVDVQLFVIDVAGGEKVPRKGGPGITASDLLVVNKTDLAPHVGADLDVMARDAAAMRGERPFVLISLREDPSAAPVVAFVRRELDRWRGR
jgi:urease accessory protein